MKKCLLYLLCVFPVLCWAQAPPNLNGIWKGTLTQNAGGCFPKYFIELQIQTAGDSIRGASYHYSDITNYVKKKFQGSYFSTVEKLYLAETGIQTFKIPPDCVPCIKNYELRYYRVGNEETLRGEWTGKVMSTDAPCQPGSLILTRVAESAFREIPEIEVDTGKIRLDFYDNAEVDGDSISVLVNNKVLLSHQKLNLQPITTWIQVDLQNKFQEVEMQAENLGRIPPNTALLVVTAGNKSYRLLLTATDSKSAKVRFIYEPAVARRE